MSKSTRLFALFGATLLLLSVVVPAVSAGSTAANEALSVDVTQSGEDVTVTVTENDTGVANATVAVNVTERNATYEGPYTTDDDGEVELDAPEENTTVEVTATVGNETATATAQLTNASLATENETDAFGQQVASFVAVLQSENTTDTDIGPAVSEFVTANNPGADNRPDHAGPPENKTDTGEQGPPSRTRRRPVRGRCRSCPPTGAWRRNGPSAVRTRPSRFRS